MPQSNLAAIEELKAIMVQLSGYWYATWMRGVEFALWDAVQGKRHWLALMEITEADADRARLLSEQIQGWIAWPDDWKRPGYVPINTWREIYAAHQQDNLSGEA